MAGPPPAPKTFAPFAAGTALGALSALLFGVTAPVVQRLGEGVGPFTTATLLYAGAFLFAAVASIGSAPEGPAPAGKTWGRLALVALAGAVAAPVALAFGLQRASGVSASLLLNLESVFTLALGVAVHKEHLGRRVLAASALTTAGGVLLVAGRAGGGSAELSGLCAVAAATLFWALDNTLSRPLADLDTLGVVGRKSLLGALLSGAIGLSTRETLPAALPALGLVAAGTLGYGASLRLYLLAQRRLGSARTASVFALAPFAGALAAAIMGQPIGGALALGGAALLLAGLALHVTEGHDHPHSHPALEHEHEHRHDDGHHDHDHEDPPPPGQAHTHPHRHEAQRHAHPHTPDIHHRHDHED